MKPLEIAKEIFPDKSDEFLNFVIWEETGYPEFFDTEDGKYTIEEVFRKQLIDFKEAMEKKMKIKTTQNPYRKEWMSNDQYECLEMLADVVFGFHHIPGKVKPWGDGIEINIYGSWASFDFSQLTRCIVLGHDKMIRVEVGNSGRGMFRLILHKRHTRKGNMSERMPTIEDAIKEIRGKQ